MAYPLLHTHTHIHTHTNLPAGLAVLRDSCAGGACLAAHPGHCQHAVGHAAVVCADPHARVRSMRDPARHGASVSREAASGAAAARVCPCHEHSHVLPVYTH
eukprot:scaffold51751_cov20-Tisochrysis_lutea.AAC.1